MIRESPDHREGEDGLVIHDGVNEGRSLFDAESKTRGINPHLDGEISDEKSEIQVVLTGAQLDRARKLGREMIGELARRGATPIEAAREFYWGLALKPVDAWPLMDGFAAALGDLDRDKYYAALEGARKGPIVDERPRGWRLILEGEETGSANPARKGREANPDRLAQSLIEGNFTDKATGLRTLQFWQGQFHEWRCNAYRPIPDHDFRAIVNRHIAADFDEQYREAMGRHRRDPVEHVERKTPKLMPVRSGLVTDVVGALKGLALIRSADCPTQPAWVDRRGRWPANEIMPTATTLVHLPSLVEGLSCTMEPTPNFFGQYTLDFGYDPDAPEPHAWIEFLARVWPDDPESILVLQEWFGYLLTPDTSQQKIAMLVGPTRSGKGTIGRVIKGLIGSGNVGAPTLSGLATNFGLAPLLDKPVAIISDARISGRTDTAVVVERLLSISGEDGQTVDRKNREPITTRLPTRIMILSNELPNLRDASGALAGRLILLPMTESFAGREDPTLYEDKLRPQLPGILEWAVRGWARLRQQGKFTVPSGSLALKQAMEELASPIAEFLRECCVLEKGKTISRQELFRAWRDWCESRNQSIGDEAEFGRNLHAAVPGLGKTRPREQGFRVWCYTGLGLRTGGGHQTLEDSVQGV